MQPRYLLIMRSKYGDIKTNSFYTLEETKTVAEIENNNQWATTIIDLATITWQGEK